MYFFFQWIDGADKFDPRYLFFVDWLEGDIHVSTSSGGFHPPTPLSMTAKEKHLAAVR